MRRPASFPGQGFFWLLEIHEVAATGPPRLSKRE